MKKTTTIILSLAMIVSLIHTSVPSQAAYSSDELISRLTSAINLTGSAQILGCRAPIGGSLDGVYTIYRDVCNDTGTGLIRHIESYASADDEQSFEGWYDTKNKLHYIYDTTLKKYIFTPGDDGEEMLSYLSLDYYLDPDSIEIRKANSKYTYEGVTALKRESDTIPCDKIRIETLVEDPFIHIDDKTDTELLKSLPTATPGTNNLDKTPVSTYFYITTDYYIGQSDGRLYRIASYRETSDATDPTPSVSITPAPASSESDDDTKYSFDMTFYFPTTSLSIPDAYTTSPQLAANSQIKKSSVIYTSYYKKGKTVLAASDFAKKKSKKLTIPKTIKVQNKSYKIVKVDTLAFYGMKKLTKITIGKNVTSIGKLALAKCPKLKTIVIKNKTLRKKLKKKKKTRTKIGISDYVKIKA